MDCFADLIRSDGEGRAFAATRAAETTGRPLGAADFVEGLKRILRRPIAKRAPGRRPKVVAVEQIALL